MTMRVSVAAIVATASAATASIATPIQDKLLFVSFPVSLRWLHLLLCACDFGWFLGCSVHIVAHRWRGSGCPVGWH